jgi:TonB family protein
MKVRNSLLKNALVRSFTAIAFFAMLGSILSFSALGQSRQLSLADLLIGLRSQKVTLPERNQILADAVKERGITFVLTPEIQSELESTGADAKLIAALQEKSSAQQASTQEPEPDFDFYRKQADENTVKGEYWLAIADYSRAAEFRSDDPAIFLGRGWAHFNLRSYDRSLADFNRVIELSPSDSAAFMNRGLSYEKLGEVEKAIEDLQKAVELDNANELAKGHLNRIEAELAKAAQPKPEPPVETPKTPAVSRPQPAPEPVRAPEFVSMGTLSSANAIRMVTPIYNAIARRSNIEGRVVVEVEVNEKGDVVSANAVSGHQLLRSSAEEAARRSKFRPATYDGKPYKGRGQIVYNFSLRPGQE